MKSHDLFTTHQPTRNTGTPSLSMSKSATSSSISPATFIFSLVIILPCLAAVLAAYGLAPQRADTIGVDLGTTFSVVAYKDPMTKKIIMVPSDGKATSKTGTSHFLTPSVVAAHVSNQNVLVGRKAMEHLQSSPKTTVYNAKRLIGRTYDDVSSDTSLASMPFDFGPVDTHAYCAYLLLPLKRWRCFLPGKCTLEQSSYDACLGKKSVAGFVLDSSTTMSPVQVAAHVVRSMSRAVDTFLGHKNARKAIIAVPAQFNAAQREATAEAFRSAGIRVVNMLEEPTAAAIAYGLQNQPHVHNVLVYDFGGGTLDVSLLWMHVGSVQVIGTDGDSNLGGSDFDKCMVRIISNEKNGGLDQCSESKMRKIAEDAKKELSSRDSMIVSCGDGIHLSSLQKMEVTRLTFEKECDELFQRGIVPVERLLENHNMLKSEIDEVVLVGGTTRIPRVKEMLKVFFNGRAPKDDIDPDLAVAYGAAMFSA